MCYQGLTLSKSSRDSPFVTLTRRPNNKLTCAHFLLPKSFGYRVQYETASPRVFRIKIGFFINMSRFPNLAMEMQGLSKFEAGFNTPPSCQYVASRQPSGSKQSMHVKSVLPSLTLWLQPMASESDSRCPGVNVHTFPPACPVVPICEHVWPGAVTFAPANRIN
jgi:hypothetical protein